MTRSQFEAAARRVNFYGHLLMGVTAGMEIAVASFVIWWAGPQISQFGDWIRGEIRGEGAVGLVAGLVAGVVLAPMLLIPLMPFVWMDRRFGLKCPGCGRSVTLRCLHTEVLRSGRCCLCKQFLFEASELVQSPKDISVSVHLILLAMTGLAWTCYSLSLLPLASGSDLIRGAKTGSFGCAFIYGTIAAGSAVWVSLRVRRRGSFWAAAASLPLAALCWWQAFHESIPGRP